MLGGMGGVAIGLSVGWMISYVRRRTEDAYLETTLALFTGYATFRPKNSVPPAEESAPPVEATAVYRAAFEVAEEAGSDDETAKQAAEQAVAEADTAPRGK